MFCKPRSAWPGRLSLLAAGALLAVAGDPAPPSVPAAPADACEQALWRQRDLERENALQRDKLAELAKALAAPRDSAVADAKIVQLQQGWEALRQERERFRLERRDLDAQVKELRQQLQDLAWQKTDLENKWRRREADAQADANRLADAQRRAAEAGKDNERLETQVRSLRRDNDRLTAESARLRRDLTALRDASPALDTRQRLAAQLADIATLQEQLAAATRLAEAQTQKLRQQQADADALQVASQALRSQFDELAAAATDDRRRLKAATDELAALRLQHDDLRHEQQELQQRYAEQLALARAQRERLNRLAPAQVTVPAPAPAPAPVIPGPDDPAAQLAELRERYEIDKKQLEAHIQRLLGQIDALSRAPTVAPAAPAPGAAAPVPAQAVPIVPAQAGGSVESAPASAADLDLIAAPAPQSGLPSGAAAR